MKEIVIVSAVRTPFGKYGGSLKDYSPVDLGAIVMREVIGRVNYTGQVDDVFWGVGDTASFKDVYTPVIARQTLLKADLAPETSSLSLDKACVSATTAIRLGLQAILAGEAEVVIAGGVTIFSQMPLIVRNLRFAGHRMGPVVMEDPLFELGYKDFAPVAVDAGNVALLHGVSRQEQDEWAVRSHLLYGQAYNAGKFQAEMIPVRVPSKQKGADGLLEIDEQYRPDVSLEKLAKLSTIYGSPTCTAGNAPGLNDGATAVLLMSKSKAQSLGLPVLATVVTGVSIALEPHLLAEAPAAAIRAALTKSGLKLYDMKLLEINEAFAAVTLVSSKILADGDRGKLRELRDRLNVNGGAIAIGHANTASGARLVMTMVHELRRRGGGYGALAICGGLAQGDAIIVRVD
ncbi:MAG: acetyl-CoA acetyltransferase [Peptococcaceae bacterium BRH_c23]|nr:MAG: acetyl-CoA acetyltransferase [Peptococcaceae bacterium BRH_c23]KJS84230.1 MAG: acetyl-CoA acetyltransferase [Desulfosporosinus sp. BICA1-9]HBW37695.1 acetyl-CoA C-acyltransferase [Desulfosporosinus sp.]